jgi:hypothetical protein
MHVAARARLLLARRPWLYWLAVSAIAALLATSVHQRIESLDDARQAWGDTRPVLVARSPLAPGDSILVDEARLPVAAVSPDALTELPAEAQLRHRVARGDVLTTVDVTARTGPAARAEVGTVVVGLSDQHGLHAPIGAPVLVAADGLLLADAATVVDVIDDVVFVAVAAADGPAVAAAAQQGLATLLHLP